MKKKTLFMLAVMAILVCVFAISVSAATIYKTEDGTELFRYVDEDANGDFESYEGTFPKTDADGNELTWYTKGKETVGSDIVHTVASKLTLGEAGSINASGEYTFTSPVTNKNTVSVNYPDNAGILKVPTFGAYNTRNQNNILFAYMPNTLTEIPESLFQETSVIVGEFDDETPVTMIPHKICHEARNIEVVNIPASVTLINAISSNMGVPFYDTLSLKTVTFAPNSKLTRIYPFAFENSGIEEIQFPASLISVNQNLFRGCKALKVIKFGENFQYFENVDNNGNISTVHQSLTHTATSIQEIYLPASFYMSKPDINYRVSYAFDGCSNAKFFFIGTRAEFDESIANFKNSEWTTGATENNYIITAYNENKIVTWEQYSKNPDSYTGRYIITDYNKCDAYYNGEHVEDNNPCVINCDRCNVNGVAEANPVHNISTTITYVSFDTTGTKKIGCINTGCSHGTTEEVSAIFVCLGYSAYEVGGDGIAIGYVVNNEAIDEYTSITGKSISYGVFVASQNKLGENDIFDQEGNKTGGVVSVEITSYEFAVFELKVVGFTDSNKGSLLAMGAYVKEADGENAEYSYMQDDTKGEKLGNYYFVSYNNIVGKTSVE